MQSLGSLGSVRHIGARPAQQPAAFRRSLKSVGIVNAKSAPADDAEEAPAKAGTGMFSFFQPNPAGTQLFGGKKDASAAASPGNGTMSFLAGFGSTKGSRSDSANTVFVAGATGRLGLRVVRELLEAGFNVRAGVRSEEKAEAFPELLAELCETVGPLGQQQERRVKVVYCDLEDPDTIAPAIGSASRVVCAVGAAESEFTNLGAPRAIDYEGTVRLVEAAANAGVQQFVLVTSLGTGKLGFPAGVLNLFGGILIWKRKAEEALEASGMPYLIVRPGGMERPKDDHKLTHNVRLSARDTLFGGTVSRLQVAELIAAAVSNPGAAENKTVEVVAETKAPETEYEVLLAAARTEIAQDTREAALEGVREVRAEIEEAKAAVEVARERLDEAREAIAELQSRTAEARAAAKEAQKEQSDVVKDAEKVEVQLAALQAAAESKALEAAAAKAVALEAQKAAREARVLSSQETKEIRDSVLRPKSAEKETAPAAKAKAMALPPFFGTLSSKKAAPVEEEEEDSVEDIEEEVVQKASPFSFFAPKPKARAPEPESESEEEEEEEVVVVEKKKAVSPFAAFFTPQPKAVANEPESEEEEEEEEEEAVVVVEKKKSVSPFAAFFTPQPKGPESEEEVEEEIEEEEEIVEDKKAGGFFGGISSFFQPQGTVFVDDVQPAEEEKPLQGGLKAARAAAAAKQQEDDSEARAAAAARAREAAQAVKKAEAAKAAAAEAAEAKAAAAKRADIEAKAKAKAAAEAAEAKAAADKAAVVEAKAAAPATQEKAEAAPKAEANPMDMLYSFANQIKFPWQQEGAPAAPTVQASVSTSNSAPAIGRGALNNAAEARQWIANWRANTSNTAAAAPADAKAAADVPANVAEARAWIDSWRAKK